MATISNDQVNAIAALARLKLSADEQTLFAGQLSSILAYVEKLKEVPTDNVLATNQVTEQVNAVRTDVLSPASPDVRSEIIAQVPERDGDGVKVKAVFGT